MTYSVPAHGEPNWDGKISPSLQYLKDTAEAAETPTGAQAKATAAQNAAISAAATDAQTKADAAQANAIASASTDATTKANSVQSNLNTHVGNVANPHSVTKAQVGLGSVPNIDATARANHTGTQLASTISDFDSGVAAKVNDGASSTRSALDGRYRKAFFVTAYGAVGDGVADDTTAFNNAVAAAAGSIHSREVYVPAGTYLIDADWNSGKSILLNQPGITLHLDEGAVLRAKTNSLTQYAVVLVSAADCRVIGGQIIGDVGTHTGSTGEWGFGISVGAGADRFMVDRTHISKCWGDGIYVGGNPSDVVIRDVVCEDNRRQGCSITYATRPRIIGGVFKNTGLTAHTAPSAGIDIEPDATSDVIDIQIIGAVCSGNYGPGLSFVAPTGRTVSGAAVGVVATGNGAATADNGFSVTGPGTTDVSLIGCRAKSNTQHGFFTATNVTGAKFADCHAVSNTVAGMLFAGSNITVTDPVAEQNSQTGIYVFSSATNVVIVGGRTAANSQGANATYANVDNYAVGTQVIGHSSYAGALTNKPMRGYLNRTGATATRWLSCDAVGSFTTAKVTDQVGDAVMWPIPGAAKQTATPAAATDAATTQALVNDIRTKLIALGLIS